jgi:hypothetical protein
VGDKNGGILGQIIDDAVTAGQSAAQKGHQYASADSLDHYGGGPGHLPGLGITVLGEDQGFGLFDALDLPKGVDANDVFTWAVDQKGNMGAGVIYQMTLGGALAWLKDLAATDAEGYNSLVVQLVRAGYLDAGAARFGAYTRQTGQAFLNAALDLASVNSSQKRSPSSTTTLFDYLDQLGTGNDAAGEDRTGTGGGSRRSGSGSGAAALNLPPDRTDQFSDPSNVRATADDAAHAILGRGLSEAEEAVFLDSFHRLEQAWNDQLYSNQLADYNYQTSGGPTPTLTQPAHPDLGTAAQNFVSSQYEQEAGTQRLGSLIGVLRNSVGLGSMGVSNGF